MMKHYFKSFSILFLLLLFTFTYSYSQEFDWEWAVSPTGSGADVASATYTDAQGNVYVTGNFRSSTLTIGSFTLSKEGETDIFFAKYNPEGEVVWAKGLVEVMPTAESEFQAMLMEMYIWLLILIVTSFLSEVLKR